MSFGRNPFGREVFGTEREEAATTTASPFFKTDWSNPLSKVVLAVAVIATALGSPENLTLLPGKDSLPLNKKDWPNPTLPKVVSVGVTSQPNGAPRNLNLLIGKDSLPLNKKDWPNPLGPRQPIQTQLVGTYYHLLDFKISRPSFLISWPNPTLAKVVPIGVNSQPLGAPENLNVLVGGGNFPLNKKDWLNPNGPRQPLQTQPIGSYLPLINVIVVAPFAQVTWPNPLGEKNPYRAVWSQTLGVPPSYVPVTDTNTYLFRGPIIIKREPLPWRPPSQPLGTFAGLFPVIAPFYQTNWPLPVTPVSRREALESQKLGTPTGYPSALPFRWQEWPNPRGPIQPTQTQPLGAYAFVATLPTTSVYVTGVTGYGYIGNVLVYSNIHGCVDDPNWTPLAGCINPNWTPVDDSAGSVGSNVNSTVTTVWTTVIT